MDERDVGQRLDALLDRATGLGTGSLRLALLSGHGERVLDGTPLGSRAELRSWLAGALRRHWRGEDGGRFRVRLLDGGGRAAGSVVGRGTDLEGAVLGPAREERGEDAQQAFPRTVPSQAPPMDPDAEVALQAAYARISALERALQDAGRRAQEASATAAVERSRLQAELRELEEAAGRASTTAGDARRELANARAALTQAQRDARQARARAEAAEARVTELEGALAERGRAEAHTSAAEVRERLALARAERAGRRAADLEVELEAELSQARAREEALESATAGLRDELSALSAENERLRGVVLRQHATIDALEAQGALIVARVDEIVGVAERPRGRRR